MGPQQISQNCPPANIFTKEMQDGKHFCHLQNSFMSHLSDFLHKSVLVVHHAWQPSCTVVSAAGLGLLSIHVIPLLWQFLHLPLSFKTWQTYYTYQALAVTFFGVFMSLSLLLSFDLFWSFYPKVILLFSSGIHSIFPFAGTQGWRCWSFLGPLSRASRSNLTLTSSPLNILT